LIILSFAYTLINKTGDAREGSRLAPQRIPGASTRWDTRAAGPELEKRETYEIINGINHQPGFQISE
jgi:hypothetical protein